MHTLERQTVPKLNCKLQFAENNRIQSYGGKAGFAGFIWALGCCVATNAKNSGDFVLRPSLRMIQPSRGLERIACQFDGHHLPPIPKQSSNCASQFAQLDKCRQLNASVNQMEGCRTGMKQTCDLESNWTWLIDDICAGTWVNPLTGKTLSRTFDCQIVIEQSLAGREPKLVSGLGFESPYAVVSDQATHPAMGSQVARALSETGEVVEIVLDHPHADMASVRSLAAQLEPFPSVVAVGSGTINDLVKFTTLKLGRRYCVFATSGSMNGYVSSTASITLDSGLKVSLPAHTPAGFFVDLEVCAAAPSWLNAAGFGDSICRSVAQIDWWMSHRLLGTMYRHEPYLIEIPDEIRLMENAGGIAEGNIDAIGTLFRVLTLCGLGTTFTGVSNHGSMGEHQISHYVDCFAGDRHPGSVHGQQIGATTLTMARIQQHFLSRESPPEIGSTEIDLESMSQRMGEAAAIQCAEHCRRKAFDNATADRLNERLRLIWPELRAECLEFAVPVGQLQAYLEAAGGSTTAVALGIPVDFYREAVTHAHEMRDRFSFADIARGTGEITGLAAQET